MPSIKYPNFDIENECSGVVAGIDEAGRGPIAGPVVAACVVLNKNNYPDGLNDSKKLSKNKREKLYDKIISNAHYGIGIIDHDKIDEVNILNATKLAMKESFQQLKEKYRIAVDLVLVDGNFVPDITTNSKFVIKGDQKSLSIAAASIVAKVTRDGIMKKLSDEHPEYDWSKNQAYPTKFHIDKIKEIGITKYHRKTFAPIKYYDLD